MPATRNRVNHFANWLTELKNLVKDCEYCTEEQQDSMIHDQIIWGTYDKKLRQQLRAKSNLKLQELIDL